MKLSILVVAISLSIAGNASAQGQDFTNPSAQAGGGIESANGDYFNDAIRRYRKPPAKPATCANIACILAMPECQAGFVPVNIAQQGACCPHYVCMKSSKRTCDYGCTAVMPPACKDGQVMVNVATKDDCCAHWVCKDKKPVACPEVMPRVCTDGSVAVTFRKPVKSDCPQYMSVCPEDTCSPPASNGDGGFTNWGVGDNATSAQ